ncbi:hypothetical protein D3OALGB2SA_4297 [Olavius algarvensis associated proteobacterium Delta 3]|nr:hypothetical protein D3OALGB2SA_4297 [Olavius algarvensis associated proteobacterium Delta 3]
MMLQAGSKLETHGRSDPGLARKILRFTKIEHTAFSLPLVLAGAWIGTEGRTPPISILLLIIVATAGARIFGMSFNRIFDRRIDALNPRTAIRELPSGILSVNTALMVAFAGLAVYISACATLGGWCLILSPLPLIPLLGYSLLKRFTSLCHFGIGVCLAMAPLGAFVAASGHLGFSPMVIWLSLFVFLWLSGADIIYAIMDIEADRTHHIHSIPARFGRAGALKIAALCHLSAFGCLVAVFSHTNGGPGTGAAMVISTAAMAAMYLPSIPLGFRFFPIATLAGIAAALVPILGY